MQEKRQKFLPCDRDRSRMAETVARFTVDSPIQIRFQMVHKEKN